MKKKILRWFNFYSFYHIDFIISFNSHIYKLLSHYNFIKLNTKIPRFMKKLSSAYENVKFFMKKNIVHPHTQFP